VSRRLFAHGLLACLIAGFFIGVGVDTGIGVDVGAAAAGLGPGSVSVLHVASADHDVSVRDVWVYRPAVPDSRTLPVVYFLHGVPGSGSDIFRSGAKTVLDHMFASGTPPFVLAAPTGYGYAHSDTEWADSVDGRDKVETYLIDNVIPAVEGNNRRDSAHRIIAGFSMGGFGAANIALRHPNLFSAVASIAGYFHIDDPDGVFGNNRKVEDANDPELLIRSVHSVRFWLSDGTSDREPVVQGEAQRFARLAGPLVGPGDLVLAPGGHNWSYVLGRLPAIGAFVAHVVATPASAARPLWSVGYSLVGSDGGVFTFPPATFAGSLGGQPVDGTIVAALGGVVNNAGRGYLLVSNTGRVYPMGLHAFGDLRDQRLNAPIVSAAAVPGGYLLVGADGGVFTFGRARYFGSLAGHPLRAPIVGIAPRWKDDGYWLVDSTGRVYAFGNAKSDGDLAGAGVSGVTVAGIVEQADAFDPTGSDGYLIAGTDGRVFAFGAAVDVGDARRSSLAAPIRGIATAMSGYYLYAGDGGVFSFAAPFDGSTGGRHLNAPITALVAQY
jgi:S-formylglutathione hydrolase FrmB